MLLSTQWLLFGFKFWCVRTSFQAHIPSLDSSEAVKPNVAFGELEPVFPPRRNSSGTAYPELLKAADVRNQLVFWAIQLVNILSSHSPRFC